jgi:CRISPR/Cas system-associated exonuclease Cas4 (RecB family)
MSEATAHPTTLNAEPQHAPPFSYTRIQKYLTCPEQYRLYYVERLRARQENASLVFGATVHLALAELFRHGLDPAETFEKEWQAIREVELRYSKRVSWQSLADTGKQLLEKFVREEAQKIAKVIAVEQAFKFYLSGLNLPFVTVLDLVAEVKGKRTLVEFKTAAADFERFEVELLDQATAYHLADPELQQVAVCVLVKTKKPQIRWHFTKRSAEEVMDYLQKVETVTQAIRAGLYYRRPGKWCRQCEYLPVCVGDAKNAGETLVRINQAQ